MFKNLGRRIQRDIQDIVDARLKTAEELSGGRMKVGSTVLFVSIIISRACDSTDASIKPINYRQLNSVD